MMNKLTALFAMVIGLAFFAADVEAARPRRDRVAVPAAEVAAPEAAEGDKAPEAAEGDKAPEAADKENKPGFFARSKAKVAAAGTWTKGQFVNHPYRSVAITAGTVVALGLAIEAVKNGKNSWLPRAYRAMFANKTNRLADVMAARQAAAQVN